MTENTTPTPYDPNATGAALVAQLAGIVPDGLDPLDDLTVAELGTIGRQMGCDPYNAVKNRDEGAGLRWEALGRVAWLWAKRRDPRAKLDPILSLRPGDVGEVLGMFATDEELAAAGVEDEVPGVEDELAANPTAPTPE